MSFADQQARLQQAVFDRLGADATWSGVDGTVRVRRREADEELRYDNGAIVETGRTIRVRKSDVPSPAQGDTVDILDADGNVVESAVISGEPRLDRTGVWTCSYRLA